MPHWLFLPDDAIGDLEALSKLPRGKLATLREFLDSNDFRMGYKSYVKAAELLDISDESAARICSFINYVQTQRTKNKQSGESAADELLRFLKVKQDKNLGPQVS